MNFYFGFEVSISIIYLNKILLKFFKNIQHGISFCPLFLIEQTYRGRTVSIVKYSDAVYIRWILLKTIRIRHCTRATTAIA